MSKRQVTWRDGIHLTAIGKRLVTKRATSVSDAIALTRALRGNGFAADLKGSKNEKGAFGLARLQQMMVI